MIDPHKTFLAIALAKLGANVTVVASENLRKDRAAQGWYVPDTSGIHIEVNVNKEKAIKILEKTPKNTIHVVSGIRNNGYMSAVIRYLRKNNLRWGVGLETVDDHGFKGPLKRLIYDFAFFIKRKHPDFLLTIGNDTPQWFADRGYPKRKIFPFTYFISEQDFIYESNNSSLFKLGFVGQLIKRKRLDLLINAIEKSNITNYELIIIGDGVQSASLMNKSRKLSKRGSVRWLGTLPMPDTRRIISTLDCLVLPSKHDGWGVVVSEALINGVPAICSDACGSAAAVHASGVGGVFKSGDVQSLSALLKKTVLKGAPSLEQRQEIASWSKQLCSKNGANYFLSIMACVYNGESRPTLY